MSVAADLLCKLLNYVVEQSKVVDPYGFKLTAHQGFLKNRASLEGLPGVALDIEVAGDHVWLQVERLQALPPPPLPEAMLGLVNVSDDPGGPVPNCNEVALAHRLVTQAAGQSPVKIRVRDICHGERVSPRAIVMQQKTSRTMHQQREVIKNQ